LFNTKLRIALYSAPKTVLSARIGRANPLVGFAVLVCSLSLFAQNTEFEKSFQQGTQASRSGQWQAAAGYFAKAISLDPASAPAYFNLGLARLQQGQTSESLAPLTKAVALSPKLRGANLFLGIARYRSNDYTGAVEALKREVRIDPKNAQAFMWLGVVQLGAGDAEAASISLDQAASLSPGDVDILYHRGRAHMLVSKESYEQMYKADPQSWRVHQALAQSFVEADRMEDAVTECQAALRLRPNEPGLHEELGDIYWKQNQLEKAESSFNDELAIDRESLSSLYKLAVVSLERSKPEATVSLLKDLLQHSPKYPGAQYQLGRAEAQLGQVDAAIGSFNAVLANKSETDSETRRQSYYQLAQLYRRAQRPDDSKSALDSFMRLKQEADAEQAQKLENKMKHSPEAQQATR
jgi:tetratricopeptide (TPR) repeat protein